jgi:hypothetical protein
MTIRITGIEYAASLMETCEETAQVLTRWELRARPWLNLLLACLCLKLGLRLVGSSALPLSLLGLALLIRFPCYGYFAWRDYKRGPERSGNYGLSL